MVVVEKWNGTAYVKIDPAPLIGFTLTEVIDDTLDEAVIIVYNEDFKSFKLWESVRVRGDGFSRCFLIGDIETKHRLTRENPYSHTLSLIEPTKYLEKIYCSSMSFTNKDDTLLTQLRKAINNAEVLEQGEPARFNESSRLVGRLMNEPSRDFFFDKMTLREVLDGILSVLDFRAEVHEITDFNDIEIDFYDVNARGRELDIQINDLVGLSSNENVEYLGSDIEAYGENAFSGSRTPIWHPSPNGWDTFKTSEATLTTENAVMSTAFPIEEIEEFVVDVHFTIHPNKAPQPTSVYKTVNITSNVVDYEVYQTLKNKGLLEKPIETYSFLKENTIYYRRGETDIGIDSSKRKIFFTVSNLENAVLNALYRQGYLDDWLANYPSYTTVEFGALITTVNNLKWRAKYLPYINAHTRISKANYGEVKSTLIDNQSDKTIDLERYGDNLQGTINRLGNKVITMDARHYSLTEMWDLQDYTKDNFVITRRTLSFYNNFVKAHYELTENFNAINERIGIDRAKRIYNIPLEHFVRDVLIKDFMVASFNGVVETTPQSSLFMTVFNSSANKIPITNALIRSGWYSEDGTYLQYGNWYELAVAPFTMATSLHFRFSFQDNYSAGMSIENQVIGGKKVIANPYVKTIGEKNIGEHNRVRLVLLNDEKATRETDYDYVKYLPRATFSWYDNTDKLIDKTYSIEKDAYEHMTYVYQLETLSDNDNIIIGNAIAKLHPLANDVDYTLKVYTSEDEFYVSGDKKAKGEINSNLWFEVDSNVLSLIDATEPYDLAVLPNVKSWCIADNNGNILIAINKSGEAIIKNQVKFNYKTSRN